MFTSLNYKWFRENENSKAKFEKENIGKDSEVLTLKRELNSSMERVEKLEVNCH